MQTTINQMNICKLLYSTLCVFNLICFVLIQYASPSGEIEPKQNLRLRSEEKKYKSSTCLCTGHGYTNLIGRFIFQLEFEPIERLHLENRFQSNVSRYD